MSYRDKAVLKKAAENLHEKNSDYKRASNIGFFISLLYIILFALFVRSFIGEPFYVKGMSMSPTLHDGERIIIEKLSYTLSRPGRTDIVVCDYPGREDNFVKRVIGLPGDLVEINGGKVYINGIELDESAYWQGSILGDMPPRYVEEGHVFVMGDNRNNSRDSRNESVGDILYEHITGKATIVFWPAAAWRKAK